MSSIYLLGSLRNPKVPQVAGFLRKEGHYVFDDWFSPGPETDEMWQAYEKERGRTYKEALAGFHAINQFEFDRRHIHQSDIGVMVLPAGRSAHLELGYMIGRGQRGYILLEEEPDRYDLMYQFAHGIASNLEELKEMVG